MKTQSRTLLSRATIAGALALTCGFAAALTPSNAYAATDSAKDEVVYAKTDAQGSTQGIYVVNVFQGTDGTLSDSAAYESVTNLSTTQDLTQKKGRVTFDTESGKAFYYQGDMSADTPLPWDISVTYYLDGKKVSADKVQGATGDLKVVLKVKPNGSSDLADFCDSYLLQAQGTFDPDTFAITSSNATLAHSGNSQLATCLVLPGESGTFTLEGDARDFSYDGWQISAVPLSLAIDLSEQDTSQLTGKTQDLKDATSKLASGASDLSQGASDLSQGSDEVTIGAYSVAFAALFAELGTGSVASGSADVSQGADDLSAGVEEATSNLQKISDNSSDLVAGFDTLSQGIAQTAQGIQSIAEGSAAYAQGLKDSADQYAYQAQGATQAQAAYEAAVQAYGANPSEETLANLNAAVSVLAAANQAAGAAAALQSAYQSYSTLNDGIAALNAQAPYLTEGASSFEQNLQSYTGNVDTLSQKSASLTQGASDLADGAATLNEGANSIYEGMTAFSSATDALAQGAETLSDGAATLSKGASSLADGSQTLADSTQNIDDEIMNGLQQAIDDKLGGDFAPRSFVDAENTQVDTVQFVYVVEGVQPADEDASADEEAGQSTEDPGIIGRLLALFGL